jgi:hypothetical protein
MLKNPDSLSPKWFPLLFLALITFMVSANAFKDGTQTLVENLLLVLLVLSSAITLSSKNKLRRLILALAAAFIVSRWAGNYYGSEAIKLLSLLLMVLYFTYIVGGVVQFLLKSRVVDRDVILGCVAGYLLIGILISFIFALLLEFNPNALSVPADEIDYSDILYFTMISFTTIGYGDIAPVASMARLLAYFSGVIGQMYMGIVTAIIVGKFIQGMQ